MHRRHHHALVTFGLLYAWSRRIRAAVLSHDEVVHGKGTLLSKMPGDDWQKLRGHCAAYYALHVGHPGKKLLFMGQEFAQQAGMEREPQACDWHGCWITHCITPCMKTLMRRSESACIVETPALHARDCEADGFELARLSMTTRTFGVCLAALRWRGDGAPPVAVVICNFTPVPRDRATASPLPKPLARWRELLNTDAVELWRQRRAAMLGARSLPD